MTIWIQDCEMDDALQRQVPRDPAIARASRCGAKTALGESDNEPIALPFAHSVAAPADNSCEKG